MAANMTPQMPLSLPVQQAAAQHGLGTFIKTYPSILRRRIGGSIIGALIIIFFIYLAVKNISEGQSLLTNAIIALIGLGLLIIMAYAYIRVMDKKVFLFQQGFIIENKGQIQTYPWNQITEVWQKITHRYSSTRYSTHNDRRILSTTYKYRLRCVDGHQVRLDNAMEGIAELGISIILGIAQELVPRALDSIRADQTLSFAHFTINQQGMGNGHDFIPWQEVQAINVENGRITIKQAEKSLRWGPVYNIPNFFVFTAIADEMIRQFGNRQY